MQLKSIVKFPLLTGVLLLVAWNSVYFRSLQDVTREMQQQAFNPETVAQEFWDELLQRRNAGADCRLLLDLFNTDMSQAVEGYAHTVGITSTHYYLLNGRGTVADVTEDGVLVSLGASGRTPEILIATDFIFGNAVRDASGLLDVSDFPSSMEFNSIAAEINKIVLAEVIPTFREAVRAGMAISFTAAAEVHAEEPELQPLRVIPIIVELP